MGLVRPHVKNGEAERRDHEDDGAPGGEAGEQVGGSAGTKCGLRTLASKGAGQVGGTALLQQDNTNQKHAHDDVYGDDEIEENIHSWAAFRRNPGAEEGT